MSTQNNTGIPFSFSHSLSPVRLIELPPALLSLISDTDSPPTLRIKASSASTSAHSTDNHAVLTTPTQTFSLRQVYSSNSLLLLQPSTSPPQSPNDGLPTASMGVKVVSTANSYMELIPTIHDAEALLQKHIPLYHPNTPASVERLSKPALLNALPISPGEFEAAWNKLRCFCCPLGLAYRPSPAAVLRALGEITTSATAESFPLREFTVGSLVSIMDDDEEARLPLGLVEAAVAGVCAGRGGGRWSLDAVKCAAYVGRTLLEDLEVRGKEDLFCVSFIRMWKKEVPEECVELCKLDTIKGWYTNPTPNTIRFAPEGGNAAAAAAAAAPVAPAKNKWHERLGKGKRR